MEFIKLDTTDSKPQKKRIFNSNSYDLNCTFELNSSKEILKMTIEMDDINNHKHEIKSAILCENTIPGNNSFYYLLINMELGSHKRALELKVGDAGYPNAIQLNKGNLIFIDAHQYRIPNEEILNCNKIKILEYKYNPEHKKGNIIIGNP